MTELAAALAGKRIVICAGPGGVGKTTISAALGLGLAAQGQRVVVVTIDPARRLAEALGLDELGNRPRVVDPARLAVAGTEVRGELSAMMLDAKRTFDELIGHLAPDPGVRDEILANPVYRHLSTAVAGSQEFTAIAKLFELDRDGGYDTIVLDTPPSRNALDFLDAPERLTAFLEGRALAPFVASTGSALRATGIALTLLRRVTGVGLLDDLARFFSLLAGLGGGLRQRATAVQALLTDRATTFVVVTAPERAPLDEAVFFAGELAAGGMHRSAVIVNRVHPLDPGEQDVASTAARLVRSLGESLAHRVALAHADVQVLARRDAAALRRLGRELGGPPPACLADREGDIHGLDGLAALAHELLAPADGG